MVNSEKPHKKNFLNSFSSEALIALIVMIFSIPANILAAINLYNLSNNKGNFIVCHSFILDSLLFILGLLYVISLAIVIYEIVYKLIYKGVIKKQNQYFNYTPSKKYLIVFLATIVTWFIGREYLDQYYLTEEKTVILIANISGPSNLSYRISDILVSKINEEFLDEDDVLVINKPNTEFVEGDSKKAQKLGVCNQADFVIWGWYGKTGVDAIINLHLENLTNSRLVPLPLSMQYRPDVLLKEFETFVSQEKLANEFASFLHFLKGASYLKLDNFEGASFELSKALQAGNWPNDIIGKENILILMGNAEFLQDNYSDALEYYLKVYEIDPENTTNITSLIDTYIELATMKEETDYEEAKKLYNKAISLSNQGLILEPKNSHFFYMIGVAYASLAHHEIPMNQGIYVDNLIENSKKSYVLAIENDPSDQWNYFGLGILSDIAARNANNYNDMISHYIKAVDYYNQGLEVNGNSYVLLTNRCSAYRILGEKVGSKELSDKFFLLGINDCSDAIKVKNNYYLAYYNRALINKFLSEYELALYDYRMTLAHSDDKFLSDYCIEEINRLKTLNPVILPNIPITPTIMGE